MIRDPNYNWKLLPRRFTSEHTFYRTVQAAAQTTDFSHDDEQADDSHHEADDTQGEPVGIDDQSEDKPDDDED